MDILRAISDPKIFGASHFANKESWASWIVFLCALFGLPLTPEQLELYQQCTGRTHATTAPLSEAWLVCGRRGGKSFILALIAVFLAAFKDWTPYLAPGEVGTIMIIAQDRKQARAIMRFIHGFLGVPMLAQLVDHQTAESITLTNRIVIEVHSCSYRSVRGYTVVAALLDEIAVWRNVEDAANPDAEVIASIRPAQVTVPGAMMLCASSPQMRKGELWEAYRRHFGKDDDPVLVWHAPTRLMNPCVPQRDVDAALEKDPIRNRAEYLAEWRTDIEGFVTRESLHACVDFGIRERAPLGGTRYIAFVDLAGGGPDSFVLVIAHFDNGIAVIDCLREVKGGGTRAPNPATVISEFAIVLKAYRVNKVYGDNYAKNWPVAEFKRHGITYTVAGMFKNEIYLQALPLINSAKCRLLDHTKSLNQFLDLDRVVARGGRESIDHPKGGHDDLANAIAGALVFASKPAQRILINGKTVEEMDAHLRWVKSRRIGSLPGTRPGSRGCIPGRSARSRPSKNYQGSGLRFVHVDESGREITAEEAQTLRHRLPGKRAKI